MKASCVQFSCVGSSFVFECVCVCSAWGVWMQRWLEWLRTTVRGPECRVKAPAVQPQFLCAWCNASVCVCSEELVCTDSSWLCSAELLCVPLVWMYIVLVSVVESLLGVCPVQSLRDV